MTSAIPVFPAVASPRQFLMREGSAQAQAFSRLSHHLLITELRSQEGEPGNSRKQNDYRVQFTHAGYFTGEF
jgi:hypothetical protein